MTFRDSGTLSALAPIYLAHAPSILAGSCAHLVEELERLLLEFLATAQAAWPCVPLMPQDFVAHLGRHTPEGSRPESLLSVLRSLCSEDLYLACACARAVPAALRAFEERYLSRVACWVPWSVPRDVLDETRLEMSAKLLAGRSPGITTYAGRGKLESWLRTTAQNTAKGIIEKDRLRRRAERRFLDSEPPVEDIPELKVIKQESCQRFKLALEAAMTSLPSEERAVIRLYYIEGLTQDEIARLLHVDRAKISRWVKKMRETISAKTRRHLRQPAEAFDGMRKLIRSCISMPRFFWDLLKNEDPARSVSAA